MHSYTINYKFQDEFAYDVMILLLIIKCKRLEWNPKIKYALYNLTDTLIFKFNYASFNTIVSIILCRHWEISMT